MRDLSGNLYARDQALAVTSQQLEDDGLDKQATEARLNVISLHYLGNTERLFQLLEHLQPLANAAFQLNNKYFKREMVEDHLNFARTTLDRLFFEDHRITSGETLVGALPMTAVPQKPPTKSQKKKLKQRTKRKELLLQALAQTAQETLTSTTVSSTSSSVASKKETGDTQETFAKWYFRTEGSSENLKKEYTSPTLQELHQEQKTTAKKEKQKFENTLTKSSKQEIEKPEEKSEVFKENIKTVIHTPHKQKSKKLRIYHIKNIQAVLIEAGYTSDVIKNRHILDIGGGAWKVFQDIHNLSFSGEMDEVTNMIRSLGGHVDETRSGSRIGISLRHIKTNEVVGTDLLCPSAPE